MNRYQVGLILILSVVSPALSAPWAEGLFQEVSKDFGSVPRGPMLQHVFTMRNNTTETVRISGLRVSCGCTTATAERTVLRPGEEAPLLVRMDTTRFLGIKSVTIYVQFDQPSNEEARLWVRANTTNNISITPETFAFGSIKRGSSPALTSRVGFVGNGSARILSAQAESNYILPSFRELTRSPGEVYYEVTAKIRNDAPIGRWFTDVWLTLDNPNMSRVRIPLTVEIESPLSVSPSIVVLGDVRIGMEIERKIILRGIKPFKVTGVKGSSALLTIQDSADASKPVHVLTLRFKPNTLGDFNRVLEIVTDLDGVSSIDVQTTARVMP